MSHTRKRDSLAKVYFPEGCTGSSQPYVQNIKIRSLVLFAASMVFEREMRD